MSNEEHVEEMYYFAHISGVFKEFSNEITKIIQQTNWKELYGMTATPKLKHWMINKRLKSLIEELTIESLKECEMEENENKELLKALDYYTDFTQSIEDKTLS